MVVQDHTGLVPLLIWAHYIFDLSVLAKQTPDGDIHFGEVPSTRAEVVINWDTQGGNLLSGMPACQFRASNYRPTSKRLFP